MTTYITRDGIEVKATGRTAQRTLPASQMVVTLIEITPVSEDDGTWKKWLQASDMYVVNEPTKE
jgi:hypothetical protein